MNRRDIIWAPVESKLPGRLDLDAPMGRHTTMGAGGTALALAQPETFEELGAVLGFCREQSLPYYIMGAGSNLLFLDGGYDGVVMRLGPAFKNIDFPAPDTLRAGAAAQLNPVLEAALGRGLAGLECLAGIPGTVGGAVWMNAGSFGSSVGRVVSALKYVSAEGELGSAPASALSFSYRRLAGLPPGAVIVEAEFKLEPGRAEAVKAAVRENLETRALRHPKGQRSAGSVFKNPPQEPAGRIIEACGLKGLAVGGAQVSEKHANFIVNPKGEATAGDVLKLVKTIIAEVKAKRGLTLEPEIKIIGRRGEVGLDEEV